MQVPERLALIGGSILLSSTLVFTLKSQASSIIPNVSHSISGVFDHIGDAQKASDFDNNYQQAQKNGWKTGIWGSSKYYVDDKNNMYVGSGELQGNSIRNMLGDNGADSLKSINIEQPVKAPQDSHDLFSTSYGDVKSNSNLKEINGLDKVDTSQAQNMNNIFTNDSLLKSLDGINNWDVSKVSNLNYAFYNTGIFNLDLSNWHTSSLTSGSHIFVTMPNLKSLNLQNFDTTNANMANVFGGYNDPQLDSLSKITLGDKAYLKNGVGIIGNWTNGQETLGFGQLLGASSGLGSVHPGTWNRE